MIDVIDRVNEFNVIFIVFVCVSFSVFKTTPQISAPLNINTWYGENNDTFNIALAEGTNIDGNTTLQVNLKFISQLTNTLQGFYRVLYEDSDSDKKK